MVKHKCGIILFILLTIFGCNQDKIIGLNNKFETKYRVYYGTGSYIDYKIYTDSEVVSCSFNGTNYLIESGNNEELFSSTAPIRIVQQYKYDSNGNRTKYIN